MNFVEYNHRLQRCVNNSKGMVPGKFFCNTIVLIRIYVQSTEVNHLIVSKRITVIMMKTFQELPIC